MSDWYAAGTFFIQLAFLVSVVWFARNILRTARALQEQIGALLKLSMVAEERAETESVGSFAAAPAEMHSPDAFTRRPVAEVSPFLLTPPEPRTFGASAPLETRTVSLPSETRTIFGAEPMETGTNESVGAWGYMVRWMQTPMRSSPPRSRIMRWLLAPSH
ncbi:MAG TPA: hypothetical protein VN982_05680 [Candidatus Dormibacteraeota bacterium]|jgi:hypothetical protein|nr:hypothetical protein [Candidatus Dormibacteraeota bacterium]